MQYAVENLENCIVYLMDISESVTIDECKDCKFLVSPVGGPVFLRNCKNCNFVIACHQFRTRECASCKIKLFCSTKPIIEDSKDLQFGCYDYYDVNLKSQFYNEEISIYTNSWSEIYDFTPNNAAPDSIMLKLPSSSNFRFLPEYETCMDLIPPLPNLDAEYCTQNNFIPLTYGHRVPKLPEEHDVLMMFLPGRLDEISLFFQCLKDTPGYNDSWRIVQTYEKKFASNQMEPMWKMKYVQWLDLKWPLVSIVANGEGVSKTLEETARRVLNNSNLKWFAIIDETTDVVCFILLIFIFVFTINLMFQFQKKILAWLNSAP